MLASSRSGSRHCVRSHLFNPKHCVRRFSNDRFAPRTFKLRNGISLHIAQGDVTLFHGDAVINAASERMLGGGGVDGAIHRAAGGNLLQWIKDNVSIIDGNSNSRCLTGNVVLTPGFGLNTEYIIHTVGPIYNNYENPAVLLRSCYDNCLKIGIANNMKSIAFPAISCGVYGYPKDEAIEIAFNAFEEIEKRSLDNIWFIVFGKDMLGECLNAASLFECIMIDHKMLTYMSDFMENNLTVT
eukprot:UN13238